MSMTMTEPEFQPLAPPPHPPRSIDDFLESAYESTCARNTCHGIYENVLQRWRYYVIFLALGLANSGDSAEMGCTSFLLASSRFQRDILRGDAGTAIAGAHFAGMVFSGVLAGVLADVWGRRSTLLLGLASNTVVGVASALARNSTELALLRFTCGLGLGMVISGVVTLSAEISPPSKRGRFMTLVAACYTLGFLYTSFWGLVIFKLSGSGSWRWFMFMNALPTLVAFVLVACFVTESPRFYLFRGRLEDAARVSNELAAKIGRVDRVMTGQELRQHLSQAKGARGAGFGAEDAPNEGSEVPRKTLGRELWTGLSSIRQVFANGMHKVTVPLLFSYVCLMLATGVATWWTKIFQNLNLAIDVYALSFCQTLAQIPGVMLASGLIDIVGRRRLLLTGLSGVATTFFLLSMFAKYFHNSEESTVVEAVIVLGLACFNSISLCLGWLSLDCLSAESFPTKIRSTGTSVCKATGRIAIFSVQFLYGPLVNTNRLSHMLGIASIFAVCGILISYQTTDTTNADLNDHWDSFGAEEQQETQHEKQSKGIPFGKTTQMEYKLS